MKKTKKHETLAVIELTILFIGLLTIVTISQATSQIQQLAPGYGPIGTVVKLNGTIDTTGGHYTIGFDRNYNGNSFESDEIVATSNAASSSKIVNESITVPTCPLSPRGSTYANITLRDDSTNSTSSTYFSITTSFSMDVSPQQQLGTTFPIYLKLTAGYQFTPYIFDSYLLTPQGNNLTSLTLNITSDKYGTASTNRLFPNAFPGLTPIPGNYTVTSTAHINGSPGPNYTFTRTSSFQIFQTNHQPNASISIISPNPALEGQQVKFDGNGIDSDGDIIAYNWTSNRDGFLSNLSTFNKTDLSVGIHTISLKVEDNNNSWSNPAYSQLEIIRVNDFPNATINNKSQTSASFGQLVTFTGTGFDKDGTIIKYNWTSSIDGFLSGSNTFSTQTLSMGQHIIYFQVQDNDLVWSQPDWTSLTVNPPNVNTPTAHIDSITSNKIAQGQSVTFVGHGTDSDGYIINYLWTSSRDGSLSSLQNFSSNTLSVGNHTIFLQVQDNSNAWSDPVAIDLEVIANQPPTAVIDSSVPKSIAAGKEIRFVGYGNDNDGNIVAYLWKSNITGDLSSSNSFTTSNLPVGTHTISFLVQDNAGIWSQEATITLKIEDSSGLPWIIIGTVSTAGIATGTSLFARSKINKNKGQKKDDKEKEEKDKDKKNEQKKLKTKHALKLESSLPVKITSLQSYNGLVNLKNVGTGQAKNVTVTAIATPGLILEKTNQNIDHLDAQKESQLIFPIKLDNQTNRGVYFVRFSAGSNENLPKANTSFTRYVKTALLSERGAKRDTELITNWLNANSYAWDELNSADNLGYKLLNYDLLIIAPGTNLPPQWVSNIASYVENYQSLLLIGKISTSEQKALAELLGYSEMKYEFININQATSTITDNQHFITKEFSIGDQVPIQSCKGEVCKAEPTTAKVLLESTFPAITANLYGEGKVVHLNFSTTEYAGKLDLLLKKTFEWLLSKKTAN
jgi:hypothetical protein